MATNTQQCKVHRFTLVVVPCEDQSAVPPFDPFAPAEPEGD